MKISNGLSLRNPTFYPWLVVIMLSVVGCLNYLDRMMITTMRSSLVEAIPMSETQFGLLTPVFLWVYGLLSPVAGFLADRFNRSKVIIASLFVWSLVTFLTSHATTFNELLLTRALMGVSEACYIPAALALIVDYHQNHTRSLATGIHMGGIMVGQSLGFVGGWLAEIHSWNFAFSIMGIFGIGFSVLLLFTLKDRVETNVPGQTVQDKPPKIDFRVAIKDLFSRKSFNLAIVFWGLFGVVNWLVVGWLPTYYKEHFSLSQSIAGVYATGYFHAASLVGVILGGFLADYWSRTNPRARILVPMLGLLAAAPAIFIASGTLILWIAVVCFMFYALTRAFTDANMMPILCLVTDKRYRATAYGVLNMFGCLVGGAGIYFGGVLRDADIDLGRVFQLAAGILLICVAVIYSISPSKENIISKDK